MANTIAAMAVISADGLITMLEVDSAISLLQEILYLNHPSVLACFQNPVCYLD